MGRSVRRRIIAAALGAAAFVVGVGSAAAPGAVAASGSHAHVHHAGDHYMTPQHNQVLL